MESTSVRAAASTGLLATLLATGSFAATVQAATFFRHDDVEVAATTADDLSVVLDAEERRILEVVATSSTVQVRATACRVSTRGSGLLIDGSVWTAAHVVDGAEQIEILRAGLDEQAAAELVDVRLDLASLAPAVAGSLPTGAPVVRATPVLAGEPVLIAGYPGGAGFALVETSVHHVDIGAPWGLGGEVVLLDGQAAPGTSGGPVFDRLGQVIGLVHGYEQATGLTVVAPLGGSEFASSTGEEIDHATPQSSPTTRSRDC